MKANAATVASALLLFLAGVGAGVALYDHKTTLHDLQLGIMQCREGVADDITRKVSARSTLLYYDAAGNKVMYAPVPVPKAQGASE